MVVTVVVFMTVVMVFMSDSSALCCLSAVSLKLCMTLFVKSGKFMSD